MSKLTRTIGVVASAGLITGALVGGVGPAQAAKKKCGKFKASKTIASDSGTTAEASKAKVQKITDKYTAKKPLTIKYAHGPAAWFITDPVDAEGQRPIIEDTEWFNFQVDSKKRFVGLYIRQEWSETPVSDMDLYLYDRTGAQVGTSGDFNQVQGTPINSNTGGQGFEQISGFGVTDCSGYTTESRAFTTPGEDMTLKVWLGSVQ